MAEYHTNQAGMWYGHEIAKCIEDTKIYDDRTHFSMFVTPKDTIRQLYDDTTVSVLFNETQDFEKVTILNFASYKRPCEGFLKGHIGQEEMLCHESFLYNVLNAFPSFYEENRKHINRNLYAHRALYIKDVVFRRAEKERKADIISCSPPNTSKTLCFSSFTQEENHRALLDRAAFIKNIAESNRCETLILGAWGCGMHGQDPVEVAQVFKQVFSTTSLGRILYAVPRGKGAGMCYKAFETMINGTTAIEVPNTFGIETCVAF